MKRNTWAPDPGLGVAIAIATVAAWPLLSRASLPTLTDAHHHIYRTYEVLAAWHAGIAYPRWAPDFYFGFGYPLFNYYSPLTYYLAAAYGWFFGPVAGIKFVLVLAAYLGAVAVYLFVRDEWGPAAGALGVAVYTFAPYIVLVDPIQRGAVPEALAIALAPLVLWSFTRLSRTGSRRYLLSSAILLAALVIAHNLLSFVFIGLLGGWLLWDSLLIRRPPDRLAYGRLFSVLAGAGLLALALTAFMWLPAALERNAVQFQNAFVTVQTQRYLDLGELVRPMTPRDVQTFVASEFQYRFGWPQWMLALLGALTLLRPSPHRRVTLFFLLVTLVCLGLMVPQSAWLWDHISLLPYLQYSFRLMGVTSLSLAFLAAAAVDWVKLVRLPVSRNGLAVILTTVVIFAGLPLLNPLPWPDFGAVNPKAILDLDLYGLWGVGTTWEGEFLPVTVQARPGPVDSVSEAIAAGLVDKVDRLSPPAGVVVDQLRHDFVRDEFNVSAASGFVLRLYTFDWPGWTAYVDGVKTTIQAVEPQGWIGVAVPPGHHSVVVRLEDTAPRRWGWAVSAAGLAVAALVAAWAAVAAVKQTLLLRNGAALPAGVSQLSPSPQARAPGPVMPSRRRGISWSALAPRGNEIPRSARNDSSQRATPGPTAETNPRSPSGSLPPHTAGFLGTMALLALLTRAGLDLGLRWDAAHVVPLVAAAQEQRYVRFDDGLALVAYDLPVSTAQAGAKLSLTLYWQASQAVPAPASVFVHFYDSKAQLWGQADQPDPVERFPATRWPLGVPLADAVTAMISPNAPPGTYTLAVGLWDRATGARSHPLGANGQPTDQDKVVITDQFEVRP